MSKIQWHGDLMNRKDSGVFLYNMVQKKYLAKNQVQKKSSIIFALDGEWGSGKSFFIERWSEDIKNCEHLVIHFDAWKNDLTDEPLVGFMAEVNNTLKPLIKKIPKLSPASLKKLTTQAAKVIKQAGRAIGPTAMIIGKGLAANYISKEGVEALGDVASNSEPNTYSKDVSKITERAVEKYFNEVLKSHTNQKNAIAQLVAELELLAGYLEETKEVNLPIYFFIDELDRCRPSYAIRLLEGLKHLFDAKGVCFVISTNLAQLSQSIRSVYGNGFDGQRYLKRFFDFEYRLPAPNNLSHATYLVENSYLHERKKFHAGLRQRTRTGEMQDLTCAEVFAEVATAFSLDLRSQKQVFAQIEGAAASIDENETLHYLYFFVLAALAHTNPDRIDRLLLNPGLEITNSSFFTDKVFNVVYYDRDGRRTETDLSFAKIIDYYHKIAHTSVTNLRSNGNAYAEPPATWFLDDLINDSPSGGYLTINKYIRLVRLAGNISHT